MTLAGTFARRGSRVLVVDGDIQASAMQWSAAADSEPFPATVVNLSAAGSRIDREIAKHVGSFDCIIVDTPPAADSPIPRSALRISHLALIPCIPSPMDLWGAVNIRDVIGDVQAVNEALEARLYVVQVQEHTVLAREALDALESFGIPMLKTRMGHRTAYRQSAVFGTTVHTLGVRAAAAVAEAEALADEVEEILRPKNAKARGGR
jgi:chromosome partitioning protein